MVRACALCGGALNRTAARRSLLRPRLPPRASPSALSRVHSPRQMSFGSVCASWSMTSGAVRPNAKSSDANVRRSECGVRRSGSAGASSSASRSSASRLPSPARAPDGRSRSEAPLLVGKTSPVGRSARPCLYSASSSRRDGQQLDLADTRRGLRLPNRNRRPARSASRHRERESLADPQPAANLGAGDAPRPTGKNERLAELVGEPGNGRATPPVLAERAPAHPQPSP